MVTYLKQARTLSPQADLATAAGKSNRRPRRAGLLMTGTMSAAAAIDNPGVGTAYFRRLAVLGNFNGQLTM